MSPAYPHFTSIQALASYAWRRRLLPFRTAIPRRLDVLETGADGQREFNIEPSGRYLFACNLQSNEVLSLAVDPANGRLTRAASTQVPRAAVIDFAML